MPEARKPQIFCLASCLLHCI